MALSASSATGEGYIVRIDTLRSELRALGQQGSARPEEAIRAMSAGTSARFAIDEHRRLFDRSPDLG